jgi:hypothetical protein
MEVERLIGDGDGEARPASRLSRSRPPGVLKSTSWGDLGGQLSLAFTSQLSVESLQDRHLTYFVTLCVLARAIRLFCYLEGSFLVLIKTIHVTYTGVKLYQPAIKYWDLTASSSRKIDF